MIANVYQFFQSVIIFKGMQHVPRQQGMSDKQLMNSWILFALQLCCVHSNNYY